MNNYQLQTGDVTIFIKTDNTIVTSIIISIIKNDTIIISGTRLFKTIHRISGFAYEELKIKYD